MTGLSPLRRSRLAAVISPLNAACTTSSGRSPRDVLARRECVEQV